MGVNLRDPIDVAARTMWGEARGDGSIGMLAVGLVIRNRAMHPRWWGTDALSVCLAPWQFSCWNENDPNRPKLLAVDTSVADFPNAIYVARLIFGGGPVPEDVTKGADSYFASNMSPAPEWSWRARYCTRILRHKFWAVEIPAPSGEPDAPNYSMHAPGMPPPEARDDGQDDQQETADDLNAAELIRLASLR